MVVAGLMSGTSADGIDVALVEINGIAWKTRFRLKAFRTIAYPERVRRRVLEIASGASGSASEISQMNFLLGALFAEALLKTCRRSGIPIARVALIGSHGQTIFHQNRAVRYCGVPTRSTLQIGEPAVIAERTGITTIADFRPADIAAGGQGAPLVPFFDYLVYRHPRRGRVVLNIGGIANLTAIPGGGGPEDVIAFDTGPGNVLLDLLASLATKGRQSYDRGGALAAKGTVSEPVLRQLLRRSYFKFAPPKSAGREEFGPKYLKRYFIDQFGSSPVGLQDALATATVFTAESIACALADFVVPKFPVEECFVSGGGVRNGFLMRELERRLQSVASRNSAHSASKPQRPNIVVRRSDSSGIPADAKEAVAFAVLAYHTFHKQPSNLCAATGARHPAILGKVVYGER